MKIYKITTYIILLFTLLSITGCGGRSEYRRLVALEKVLEENPDSVRSVLCAMPTPEKERNKALYTVLKTQAYYKCYEPVTDFDSVMLEATAYYETKKKNYYAALAYYTLGCVYKETKNSVEAIDAYLKAKERFPDTIINYYAKAERELGILFLDLSMLDEAKEELYNGYKNAVQMGENRLIGDFKYYIATYNMYCGYYNTADTLFTELLANNDWQKDAYFQKAKISNYHKNSFKQALYYINKEIELSGKNLFASSICLKGDIYMYNENYDSALYYYNKVLECKNISLPTHCNTYYQLSHIEKIKGNMEQYFAYKGQYLDLKDSIIEMRNNKRIDNIILRHKAELADLEYKNRTTTMIIIVSAILCFIALSVFIAYMFAKNWKRKQQIRINREIEKISDVMNRLRLNNAEYNGNNLSDIVNSYNSILEQCTKHFKESKAYNTLTENISNETVIIKNRDLISDSIMECYSSIIMNMIADFQGINQTEIITCILFYLEIPNGTIAMLDGISKDAVRQRKSRILKKYPPELLQIFIKSATE